MDIQVKHLSVSFPDEGKRITVLRDANINIKCGKITAVVGESGSGKSILGGAIIGLLDKTADVSGEVVLGETDLLELDEEEMNGIRGERIGWIAQDPISAMNPMMKVGSQLVEGVCFHGHKTEKEEKETGLKQLVSYGLKQAESIWNDYPYQLSGGMAQRVLTAMMTFPRPEWVIADEPTKGLDAFVRQQVADAFRNLKDQGIGILLVTHDLRLAERISDFTAVMRSGSIVEFGDTSDIFKNPAHPYTVKLLAAMPKKIDWEQNTSKNEIFYRNTREDHSIACEESGGGESDSLKKQEIQPLLSVEHLTKSFDSGMIKKHRKPILHDVSFTIMEGETVGLTGASGAGKSTISRIIMQLMKPETGKIIFDGCDMAEMSGQELIQKRQKMQMLFQNPQASLNPRMKIRESMEEPVRIHKAPVNCDKEIPEIMDKLHLKMDLLNRYPHQLSGGEIQRICLGRLLLLKPKLLILDEPTSMLDVSVQAEIMGILSDIQRERKMSYLFISHDLELLGSCAHRIGILERGKLVEFADVDKIYRYPSHEYTERLLSAFTSF